MKTQIVLALVLLGFNVHAAAPVVVNQLLTGAQVDLVSNTATLPLRLGHLADARKVWFVLTDTTDAGLATQLGINHSTQLAAVMTAKSTRTATMDAKQNFVFEKGAVDFKPKKALVPGAAPNFFPPKMAQPGSVGDANYSPFVHIAGTNIVFNAPILAFDVEANQLNYCAGNVNYDLVHDRVTQICPAKMTVTLSLGNGFAGGDQVIYLSFDSNNSLPATMEAGTYTPATQDLTTSGARQPLFAFVNGPTGVDNPQRQGFDSALSGEGAPLNILDGLTIKSRGYTPLWDINASVWTDAAISEGARVRVTSGDDADTLASKGLLTNPMGGKVGSLGLLVNCPVVGFVK